MNSMPKHGPHNGAAQAIPIALTINGEVRHLTVEPWTSLLDLLRDTWRPATRAAVGTAGAILTLYGVLGGRLLSTAAGALMLMRETATPFKMGVAMVPVTNLFFRLSYKGPGYQRSFSTQEGLRGLPFEKREEYIRRSPYYHVDSLRTPLLVHVATNDDDVNFEEAQPLIDALRARLLERLDGAPQADCELCALSCGAALPVRTASAQWLARAPVKPVLAQRPVRSSGNPVLPPPPRGPPATRPLVPRRT